MKKIMLTMVLCFSSVLLMADMDLRVQNFTGVVGGSAEVVSTGWKNYGLKLVAGNEKDLRITYKQIYSFYPGQVYELSADVSGKGTPFVELNFLDKDNKLLKTIPMPVKIRRGELDARLDLRGAAFEQMPSRFQVVIGVKKGTSVLIEDVELDIDND